MYRSGCYALLWGLCVLLPGQSAAEAVGRARRSGEAGQPELLQGEVGGGQEGHSHKHDHHSAGHNKSRHDLDDHGEDNEDSWWWGWLDGAGPGTENEGGAGRGGHREGGAGQGVGTSAWLAGLASVTVISVSGLAAVAVIPLLRGPRQAATLQALVSLAAGTLVGDSLIHLLPHALQNRHGQQDQAAVWKGFLATLTVILLFVLDQVLTLLGHAHTHDPPSKRSAKPGNQKRLEKYDKVEVEEELSLGSSELSSIPPSAAQCSDRKV